MSPERWRRRGECVGDDGRTCDAHHAAPRGSHRWACLAVSSVLLLGALLLWQSTLRLSFSLQSVELRSEHIPHRPRLTSHRQLLQGSFLLCGQTNGRTRVSHFANP